MTLFFALWLGLVSRACPHCTLLEDKGLEWVFRGCNDLWPVTYYSGFMVNDVCVVVRWMGEMQKKAFRFVALRQTHLE